MATKSAGSIIGFIFAVVFALPFTGFGLFAVYSGLSGYGGAGLGVGAFGLLFVAVGLGVVALAFRGSKKQLAFAAIQAEHPDEPWLWTDRWQSGRIEAAAGAGYLVLWIFALAFGGMGSAGLFFGWEEIRSEGIAAVLVVSLFPLAGLGMAAGAAYLTVRRFKFGKSYCDLVTNPGVVGGWFKCAVRTRLQLSPADKIKLRLQSIHKYTTGSGKNRSTHRKVKWEEKAELGARDVHHDPGGWTTIPVKFYIPRDCRATTLENPSNRYLWSLSVDAEVPGVDYNMNFEVPVFVTPDSADEPPPEAHAAQQLTSEEVEEYGRSSKIRIMPAHGGGTEIYAPPARNIGAAIGLTVFALFWTGAIVFIISADVPILFTMVWGLFEVLILFIMLSMWFGTSRTRLRPDTIEIRNTILGFGKNHSIPRQNIEKVTVDQGMRAGNTLYYRIHVHTSEGKKHHVVSAVPSKREARWIAGVVQTYLETV